MGPVLWGLDLGEVRWRKFGFKSMMDRRWYLRREKTVAYQLTMLCCVLSESFSTSTMRSYIDARDRAHQIHKNIYLSIDDYVQAASFNVFCSVFTASIFGTAFFLDLIWPERKESKAVRLAWKFCGLMVLLLLCGDAFLLTMVTMLRCGQLMLPDFTTNENIAMYKAGSICYRDNGIAVAAVVFVWLGLVLASCSCTLLFLSVQHARHGTKLQADEAQDSTGISLKDLPVNEDQHPQSTSDHNTEARPKRRAPAALAMDGGSDMAKAFKTPDIVSTDDPVQQVHNYSLQRPVRDNDSPDTSRSELSTFSVLARPQSKSRDGVWSAGRPLSMRSLASLTSGVADTRYKSR